MALIFRMLSLSAMVMCIPAKGTSQPDSSRIQWQPTDSITIAHEFFTVDLLGFYYSLDVRGNLLKLDQSGHQLFLYNNRYLGKPAYIDPFDPFQLLLWYPAYATVVILDRTLNEVSRTDLQYRGFTNPTLVAAAPDGGIWVWDDARKRLELLDQYGKIKASSGDIRQLGLNVQQPVKLVANAKGVMLAQQGKGLWIFDAFAGFQKGLELPGLDQAYWEEQGLLYHDQNMGWQFFPWLSSKKLSAFSAPLTMRPPCTHGIWKGSAWYCGNQKTIIKYQ